ncbi:MAG: hypothetical protein QM791_08365 [Ferruginibacter sp.]
MVLKGYAGEAKFLKKYIISVILVMAVSYSVYLFLDDDAIMDLAWDENGVVESGTAIFFIAASIVFFLCFKANKNLLLLGLGLLMFVAAGEELSWGQHIFNFHTPESIDKMNVQHEFNFHNLEFFNGVYKGGIKKLWYQRLFEINMLFRLFSVGFGIALPLYFYYIQWRIKMPAKLRMPVMPVTVGVFFLLNWIVFYCIKYYLLPKGKIKDFYSTPAEIFEMVAAFIFFIASLYFYRMRKLDFGGKDIKQIQL